MNVNICFSSSLGSLGDDDDTNDVTKIHVSNESRNKSLAKDGTCSISGDV